MTYSTVQVCLEHVNKSYLTKSKLERERRHCQFGKEADKSTKKARGVGRSAAKQHSFIPGFLHQTGFSNSAQ